MFLMGIVAALVVLTLLGSAATVQLGTPRPTPDFDEGTGINFDDAVREAKSLLTNLKPGQNAPLARSTGGYIRVGYSRVGKVCINTGSPHTPALDAMAERILAALVYP